MSDTKQQCPLHKDAIESFCTQHVAVCCPICHKIANTDCTVMTTTDALGHYKRNIQSSSNALDDVREQCGSTRKSLDDLRVDLQRQSDVDTDAVLGLCDRLRAVVDNFQQECMQKIQDQTACLGSITDRISEMDELDIFLSSLDGSCPESGDVKDSGTACRPSETHMQIVNNILNLNAKSTQLKDSVSSAKAILSKDCKVDVTHSAISINCKSSTDIIDRLKTELPALSGRLVTTSEGASTPCISGVVDSPQAVAEANAATTNDPPRARSFNSISTLNYMGDNPVVCYNQSSPGHILMSIRFPCGLGKINENGQQILAVKTNTSINGMCIRDDQIFAVGNDSSLRVYALTSFVLLSRVPMKMKGSSIGCLGADFVISCPWHDDPRPGVCIISEYGCLIKQTTNRFESPNHLVVTPSEDRILVSDHRANAVYILTTNLETMSAIYIGGPGGLCLCGQTFYVIAAPGVNLNASTVLEISLDGKTQRTVLFQKDQPNAPFDISYHNQSGRLVVSCQTDAKHICVFSSTP